jgi:hypothetical protein
LILALAMFSHFYSTAQAQGSLTPPGAPAPGMKTLTQVEPRFPISVAPTNLTVPGSYYLTTNLTVSAGNVINVSANNLTLDLNGFTLSTTENPASIGAAIQLMGVTNVTIRNGFIAGGLTNSGTTFSGPGFGYGVYDVFNNSQNVRVSHVTLSGCKSDGIFLFAGSVVESCSAYEMGGYGIIAATICDSSAVNCGFTAMSASMVANNCIGSALGGSTGIFAYNASNCYGSSTSGVGLNATIANNCTGTSSTGTGLTALIANGCHGVSTSGTAISATHNVNSF